MYTKRFDPVLTERFTSRSGGCSTTRAISSRGTSASRRAMTRPSGLPARNSNFEMEFENFWSNANYNCMFTGLELFPERSLPLLDLRPEFVEGAEASFLRLKERTDQLSNTLPTLYDHLRHLHNR